MAKQPKTIEFENVEVLSISYVNHTIYGNPTKLVTFKCDGITHQYKTYPNASCAYKMGSFDTHASLIKVQLWRGEWRIIRYEF